jgi:hypothetical protein
VKQSCDVDTYSSLSSFLHYFIAWNIGPHPGLDFGSFENSYSQNPSVVLWFCGSVVLWFYCFVVSVVPIERPLLFWTGIKEHTTLSSTQQKTQEEKYNVLEQSYTESEHGKQQMHNTLSSYKQAMVLVEECVHDVRAEGETFLSNLEGERRHHEAEIVSTDYTPTAHPVLSPHKKKAAAAAAAARTVAASGEVGRNSRVDRAQERKEEQDKTVITKMDLTSTLGTSGSRSGLGSGNTAGSMFVSAEQRDTMLTIFTSIDRHHTGTVNVRDLLLALRRDQKISTFLHVPMQIHQEDPSRTTVSSAVFLMRVDACRCVCRWGPMRCDDDDRRRSTTTTNNTNTTIVVFVVERCNTYSMSLTPTTTVPSRGLNFSNIFAPTSTTYTPVHLWPIHNNIHLASAVHCPKACLFTLPHHCEQDDPLPPDLNRLA